MISSKLAPIDTTCCRRSVPLRKSAVIVPFNAVLCRAGRLLALRLRHLPRFPRRQPESKRPPKKPRVAEVIYRGKLLHLCRVTCCFLPLCAALRRTVQHFAVIVPFNAVWCRAEKAARIEATGASHAYCAVICRHRAVSCRLVPRRKSLSQPPSMASSSAPPPPPPPPCMPPSSPTAASSSIAAVAATAAVACPLVTTTTTGSHPSPAQVQ